MRAVSPILPVEPDVHLTTSIDALPDNYKDGAFSHGLQFTSGVECAVPTAARMCLTDEELAEPVLKSTDSFGGDVGFKQFLANYALECEDGTLHAGTEARWATAARTIHDVVRHQIVAGQLWWNQAEALRTDGNGTVINHSLKTAATVLGNPNAAPDPISVLSRLVAARRKLSGSGLVNIHGALVLVPYLISQGTIVKQGGRYVGPGFIYVTDEAYPDDAGVSDDITAGPLSNDDLDDPEFYGDEVGECWLYASGRIEYAWGRYVGSKVQIGENTPTGAGTTDNDGRYSIYTTWEARQNKTFINVEQQAFLRFDPCHVLAAKCYIPTITQGEGT